MIDGLVYVIEWRSGAIDIYGDPIEAHYDSAGRGDQVMWEGARGVRSSSLAYGPPPGGDNIHWTESAEVVYTRAMGTPPHGS